MDERTISIVLDRIEFAALMDALDTRAEVLAGRGVATLPEARSLERVRRKVRESWFRG